MQGFFNWLKGKKTYITAVLGIAAYGLLAMGFIDQATFETIAAVAAFLGLAFLRAGVAKSTNGK